MYSLFGKNIKGITSIKEAMSIAGLDHTIIRDPIIQTRIIKKALDNSSDLDDFKKNFDNIPPIDNFFANTRSDNSIAVGVVGKNYNILQNSVMEKFQPLLDKGEIELMTAGCLKRGERVFICARIKNHQFKVDGDYTVTSNILFSNFHDGGGSVKIGYTPIVPACWNSLSVAESHRDSRIIRINHGKTVNENIDNLFDIVAVAKASFEASHEQYKKLLSYNINKDDVEKYVIKTMELSEDRTEWATRTSNRFDKIMELIKASPGAKSFQGTVFAAYNGLNTYLNHEAGRSPESRANSIWFGQNALLNNRAFENALELVG